MKCRLIAFTVLLLAPLGALSSPLMLKVESYRHYIEAFNKNDN